MTIVRVHSFIIDVIWMPCKDRFTSPSSFLPALFFFSSFFMRSTPSTTDTQDMAHDMQTEGAWKEIHGKARELWGDMIDDDMESTKGNIEALVGKIQRKTGENIAIIREKLGLE
jgi:uncharacterized protein YjbJ (UPF0337 family)